MTRTAFLAAGILMLATAAQADSIKGQQNAEIAYCMVQTNTMSGRTSKAAIARHRVCLKEHGWLPNSGPADILPPAYIESANAAFAKADAMADAVTGTLARCRAISGTDVPASYMSFAEYAWRSRVYSACRSAAGL